VRLSSGQNVMNGNPYAAIGVIRFGKIEYALLVQRTMSLTVSMSVKPGEVTWRKSSQLSIPTAAYDDFANGVIIRDAPLGSSPIVAPRLSRWLSPLR
jgi:hypothetical protein